MLRCQTNIQRSSFSVYLWAIDYTIKIKTQAQNLPLTWMERSFFVICYFCTMSWNIGSQVFSRQRLLKWNKLDHRPPFVGFCSRLPSLIRTLLLDVLLQKAYETYQNSPTVCHCVTCVWNYSRNKFVPFFAWDPLGPIQGPLWVPRPHFDENTQTFSNKNVWPHKGSGGVRY